MSPSVGGSLNKFRFQTGKFMTLWSSTPPHASPRPRPRPSTKGHVCLTHCLSKTRMFSAGLYCVPWGKESFSLCLHGSSHPQREQWSWEPLTGLDSTASPCSEKGHAVPSPAPHKIFLFLTGLGSKPPLFSLEACQGILALLDVSF